MFSDVLALLATGVSLFTSLPQLRRSLRSGRRHRLPLPAITGSLLVAGSWFIWSIRSGETGALIGSAIGVSTHALLVWRASGRRRHAVALLPVLTFSAYAPLTAVEIVTSTLAIVVLIPNLRAVWSVPAEVAPSRWVLEASEEALWGLWAISIAAPFVAAPNALYVPVCLFIAWRASRGARQAVSSASTRILFPEGNPPSVSFAANGTQLGGVRQINGAPPPVHA